MSHESDVFHKTHSDLVVHSSSGHEPQIEHELCVSRLNAWLSTAGGSVLLYDERNLKTPAARLQCAEDAFVLDLQWRPPPQALAARPGSTAAAATAAGVDSRATTAGSADQSEQQRQQGSEPTSRPASRQTSPSKSGSGRSRFGDENAQLQPNRDLPGKRSIGAQQARPMVEVPVTYSDRPQPAALGSPPRSPRATLRQLLDGGSPVHDPAAAAAIATAAVETQRQVSERCA